MDIKGLPIWLQRIVAIATILGTIFGAWGIYIALNQPSSAHIPINIVSPNAATSTTNISDILSKAQTLQTSYEKRNFLDMFIGKNVIGTGSYDDFFGSDSENYHVLISLPEEEISCHLSDTNADANLKSALLLLKKGQKIFFSGKFGNTFINGLYREIDDCILLN